jgi:endonuclease YncB( thermonuclease family)
MLVVDVIDGDTLVVDEAGRQVSVHLLGIDAPEIAGRNDVGECFGREAADLLRHLVAGKFVQLWPNATSGNVVDEIRRYVYVVVDVGPAVAVNWALVWQGYARADSIAPNTHEQESYRQAEQAARESGRGLWASTTCNGERRAVLPA